MYLHRYALEKNQQIKIPNFRVKARISLFNKRSINVCSFNICFCRPSTRHILYFFCPMYPVDRNTLKILCAPTLKTYLCLCFQHFHMLHEERSASISERCTRSRINSAIFVSSEGRGFDSIEFLRRHGSQSVLCRKARSAENITDNERKVS